MPPAMFIGLSGVIAVPMVAEIFAVFVEDVSGAISVKTAKEKDALELSPLESVMVTVKVAAPVIVVGVPEISPVLESKVIPAGSVGAIVNTLPPEPPRAETGVKEAARLRTSEVEVDAACALSGASTVIDVVAEVVPPSESAAVTVTVTAE